MFLFLSFLLPPLCEGVSHCQHKVKKARRFLPLVFCALEPPPSGTALPSAQALTRRGAQAAGLTGRLWGVVHRRTFTGVSVVLPAAGSGTGARAFVKVLGLLSS